MKLSQAFRLGYRSIVAHKRRNLSTALIVGVLFGLLIGINFVLQGIENSLIHTANTATAGKYYLLISTNINICDVEVEADDDNVSFSYSCPELAFDSLVDRLLADTSAQLVSPDTLPDFQGTGRLSMLEGDEFHPSHNPLDHLIFNLLSSNAPSAGLPDLDAYTDLGPAFADFYRYAVAEFSSLRSLRDFFSAQDCTIRNEFCASAAGGITYVDDQDRPKPPLIFAQLFTNQVAVFDIFDEVIFPVFTFIELIIIVIAFVITLLTFLKVLQAEAPTIRLYRSLGASTSDVCLIYAAYLLEICLLSFVVAFLIGLIIALVVSFMNTANLGAMLAAAYGVNPSQPIFLIGFNWHLLLLAASLLITAIIALLCSLPKFQRQ